MSFNIGVDFMQQQFICHLIVGF